MRYVDTSVLVAYLTPESHSLAAETFMRSLGDKLAISSWAEVELLSAFGAKLRGGGLSDAEVHDAVDSYSRLVSPHLHRIAVEDADHRLAFVLLDGWRTTLRAGDGLHLAIAASRGATVYTLDRGMATAGGILGIPVTLL
jgi:predicted nucleic acid-binding protein